MNERVLKNAVNKIEISEEAKQRILSKTKKMNYRKEESYMKSKKKYSFIAIAAAMVLGITVFAANGVVTSWLSSSSAKPDYTALPTEQQCIKDIGYSPVLVESFRNGYKFKEGSIVKNNLTDENNNSIEKFKSVSFTYEKDGDEVIFSQDKFDTRLDTNGNEIGVVNGVPIYYNSYTNKIVPPDYKMTEEDKKAEENGELVFSWGSDEVKISEVSDVQWVKDGIQYMLMQIDGKLSENELKDMAVELINGTV